MYWPRIYLTACVALTVCFERTVDIFNGILE
nr:MAG TPA: hypothetical protein [Bacteriophage sp.]